MSVCTRRRFMGRGLGLGAALALGSGILDRLAAEDPPATAPRAKALIQIWLWGGPSHLDTFDPKPEAGKAYCGPYAKALPTTVDGLLLSPLLPLLAQEARQYSVLRGMTHGINSHETAAYVMQTGRQAGDALVYPSIGSIISYAVQQRGYRNVLPPFITLTEDPGRFAQQGFLGDLAKPFVTGGDPAKSPFAVEGIIAEGIAETRQRARRDLLTRLDRLLREQSDAGIIRDLGKQRDQAWDMILGKTRSIFELEHEDDQLRTRYGMHRLGQSCLMARRLVEAGIPMITINCPGWDTHKKSFQILPRKVSELDSALSTLLTDLSERGLLDSTIVWVGGEFGRTPLVDWDPPWDGGRGHHGGAFSAVLAGGGFRGGNVVGATDDRGLTVDKRPIWPWDFMASILTQFGIPLDFPLPTPEGDPVSACALADGSIGPDRSGGILQEIM